MTTPPPEPDWERLAEIGLEGLPEVLAAEDVDEIFGTDTGLPPAPAAPSDGPDGPLSPWPPE